MTNKLKQMVGMRLREARRRKDLSQEELAFKIGRTAESISNIERGQQLPTIETLAELAKELGMPLEDFLSDISGQKRVPTDRLRMETKLREIGRTLPNSDLELAVGLLEVLAKKQNQK
jgi:transcriptional regulator with XRE-family HTH domain